MTARGGDPACGLNGYTGCGTIFKITPGGTLTTIHDFEGTDGAGPVSSLIQGTDGNFYGTTQWDGANLTCPQGCGTVFSVTPSGTLTTLYSFCSVTGCTDVQRRSQHCCRIPTGLFMEARPWAGPAGMNDLQRVDWPGAVCENKSEGWRWWEGPSIFWGRILRARPALLSMECPATFTVVAATFITATVPAGATTGPVQVATPSGTLTSNVAFQVLP